MAKNKKTVEDVQVVLRRNVERLTLAEAKRQQRVAVLEQKINRLIILADKATKAGKRALARKHQKRALPLAEEWQSLQVNHK